MDNPGWHAQRRAEKVFLFFMTILFPSYFSQQYRTDDVSRDQSYYVHLPSPVPPVPPPKDYPYTPKNHDQLQPQPSESTIYPSQLTHMTAIERSEALRVARMEPYLQVSLFLIPSVSSFTLMFQKVICGPLLK